MPLTDFQKDVLASLASHRNAESHVGGGAVINRDQRSPRFSADLDFFHDKAEAVLASAEADAALLVHAGCTVEWLVRQPFLQRARVRRGGAELRLDWCFDSAFRFFPIQADPEFGYCLHLADLAVNKALALAGRSEIRDFLDVLFLDEQFLSLGAMCWAACGKDQGFTPYTLLEFAKKNMKFRAADLAGEHLVTATTLANLKEKWMSAAGAAEDWFAKLPATEAGCLYLDKNLTPFSPIPGSAEFVQALRHFGSLRGAWPRPS